MKDLQIQLYSGAPYQKMYTTLFNAITDALGLMEENQTFIAMDRLKRAQQETEELYITQGE